MSENKNVFRSLILVFLVAMFVVAGAGTAFAAVSITDPLDGDSVSGTHTIIFDRGGSTEDFKTEYARLSSGPWINCAAVTIWTKFGQDIANPGTTQNWDTTLLNEADDYCLRVTNIATTNQARVGTLTIDNTSPYLSSILWTDVDGSTAISATDTLTLTFSEPMDTSTLTTANPVTLATELGLSGGKIFGATNFGTAWSAGNTILTITLGDETDIIHGTTMDPDVAVTDVAGNPDATATPLAITDTVKPTIVSIDVDGTTLNIASGATETVTITFTEDVTIPTVLVNLDAQIVDNCADGDEKTWCFDYTIPTEQSNTKTITVTLAEDTAGNVMDSDSTNTFTVDTVSPILSLILWTDVDGSTAISATDTLTLTFSEPMDTSTLTTANPVTLATELGLSGGKIFGATNFGTAWSAGNTILTITLGDETDIIHGTTMDPDVAVTDVAGNPDATATPLAITDTVKPTIVSIDVDGTTLNIASGATETVTITFTEDVTIPTVLVNLDAQIVDNCADGDEKTWCFDYTIPTEQSNTKTITVTLAEDTAGNVMDSDSTNTFTVDTVSPILSLILWTDVDGSTAISATDTLTLTFSEPMDTSTLTTANPVTLATELGLSGGKIFGATNFGTAWSAGNTILTITLGDETDIIHGTTMDPDVAVTDVAGNPDATATPLAITDTVKPTIVSIDVDGTTLNIASGATETVTITFTEDVTIPTVLVNLDAQIVDNCADGDEKTWCFDYTIPTEQSNTKTITVTLAEDTAGNVMDSDSTNTFTVDTVSPILSLILWTDVDGSTAISATDTLTLTFSEPMDTSTLTTANPVTLATELGLSGGKIFGATNFGTAWSAGNTILTITLGDETDIIHGTTMDPDVAVTDVAGNPDATATPLAITDTVKPTIVSIDVDGTTLNIASGATETVTITFTEDVTIPTVLVNLDAQIVDNCADGDEKTWCFDYTIPTEQSNTKTITVTLAEDTAGNVMDSDSTNTFTVDTVRPTLTSGVVLTASQFNIANRTTTVTFTFNENVTGFVIGDITADNGTMSNFAGSGAVYTATYTADLGVENATNTIVVGTGTWTDTAGNAPLAGETSANYVIDTIAPTIAEVTPVTTPTNDTTPNYTFSSDEAGTIGYTVCDSATTSIGIESLTITLDALADGVYDNCTIIVTDAAGNPSNTLTMTEFRIDTIPPVVAIGDDVEKSTTFYKTVVVTDADINANSYIWSMRSGPVGGEIIYSSPTSLTTTFFATIDGTYVIDFNASDNAGNVGTDSFTLTWDTTAPIYTYQFEFPKSGNGFGSGLFGDLISKKELEGITSWSVDQNFNWLINATGGPAGQRTTTTDINNVYVYVSATGSWTTIQNSVFATTNINNTLGALSYVVFDLNSSAASKSIRFE
ncbi:MAG: Ig-like domain-containing protein [Candidatus Iainarchaeum sp.]